MDNLSSAVASARAAAELLATGAAGGGKHSCERMEVCIE